MVERGRELDGPAAGSAGDGARTEQEASQYARSLIEASLDPLVTISAEGKITDVNEATVRTTGVAREKLIGTDFSDYFTEPESARESYRRVFARGFVTDYPLTIRQRDGKLIDVFYNASLYRDVRENVLGVVAVARDVTEFRRVMRELAETTNLLNNILQSSIKYSIIGIDFDRRILSWNEGARRNYGYEAEEVLGKDLSILHVPEDVKSGAVDRLVGEAYEKGLAEGEFQRRRKDGSRFFASVVVTRRNDPSGRPIGYLLMSDDLSEKKRAAQKLQASESRLSTLINSLPQRVCLKDLGSHYIFGNRAYTADLGITPEALVGKNDYAFYPKELADKYRADDRRVLASGQAEQFEEAYLLNNVERIVQTTKVPVRDADGKTTGLLVIWWDITEGKRIEAELGAYREGLERRTAALTAANENLQALNRELEAFSYSVSHDLRAPLRAIDGYGQALIEDFADKLGEEGNNHLARIRSATQRMALMIDELLKLARISRGELEYQAVDLSAMARSVVAELRETAPERRVECVVADGIVAHGDARLLRTVLENLLGNAWKFTGKKAQARIEFGAALRDGEPVFFVRDDGAGFDMAYANKLFGAFQRLHAEAEFPGVGIGLAIVQRVILRHGGRVWAQGATGKGATFSFTLPERQGGSNGQAVNPAGGRQS